MFDAIIEHDVGLSDRELDDELRKLELRRRDHDAEMIAAILVAEARGLYGRDGHRSMNAYLRATFNWSSAEASRWRARARAVGSIDGVGDALSDGRIGADQVGEFAKACSNPRVRDALDALAPSLIRHAEELAFADFQVVMQHVIEMADADGAEQRADEAVEARKATVVAVDGELFMKATGGDAMATAELIAILDRFVEIEFQNDAEARRAEHGEATAGIPLARTDAQRRFDAIHAVFRTANAALDENRPAPSRSEPLVNVVIDDATFGRMLAEAGLSTDEGLGGERLDPFTGLSDPYDLLADLLDDPTELLERRCETTTGISLMPRHVLQALLAGHVRRVVVDADRRVVDLGRTQRLFTGAAREAALLLLRRCEHPGCTLAAERCQVDHTVEWTDEGPTDQSNSGARCGPHNRDKHRRRWRVRRSSTGRNYTIRTDGTIMLPVGCRPPPLVDDSSPSNSPTDRASIDLGRTVTWAEHVSTRPDLATVPDPGWTIRRVGHRTLTNR